jgi:hypothetical protein
MKKQNIIFKVKHSKGVLEQSRTGNVYKHIGQSRIDGFPMYSLEYPADEVFCFSPICKDFIFNCKPGYTPCCEDFEFVSSLESHITYPGFIDILPVQPMSQPSGLLYCMDFIYDTDLDERLLLML